MKTYFPNFSFILQTPVLKPAGAAAQAARVKNKEIERFVLPDPFFNSKIYSKPVAANEHNAARSLKPLYASSVLSLNLTCEYSPFRYFSILSRPSFMVSIEVA